MTIFAESNAEVQKLEFETSTGRMVWRVRVEIASNSVVRLARTCHCGREHEFIAPRHVVRCVLCDAFIGRAILRPGDRFDLMRGARLALDRASEGMSKDVRRALFTALSEQIPPLLARLNAKSPPASEADYLRASIEVTRKALGEILGDPEAPVGELLTRVIALKNENAQWIRERDLPGREMASREAVARMIAGALCSFADTQGVVAGQQVHEWAKRIGFEIPGANLYWLAWLKREPPYESRPTQLNSVGVALAQSPR